MKSSCKTYDKKTIGQFVDNELPPEENKKISKHINECLICRNLAENYTQLSDFFEQSTSRQINKIDTDLLKQNVLEKIKRKENGFFEKVFDYFSPKFYLKIASVLVIMVASLVYFQAQHINSIDTIGPSAIVNSVDGDVSSIMIFETEKTQQTIIWFSEA
jgi:hypothetical protein